jgi:hypothetical protein
MYSDHYLVAILVYLLSLGDLLDRSIRDDLLLFSLLPFFIRLYFLLVELLCSHACQSLEPDR